MLGAPRAPRQLHFERWNKCSWPLGPSLERVGVERGLCKLSDLRDLPFFKARLLGP